MPKKPTPENSVIELGIQIQFFIRDDRKSPTYYLHQSAIDRRPFAVHTTETDLTTKRQVKASIPGCWFSTEDEAKNWIKERIKKGFTINERSLIPESPIPFMGRAKQDFSSSFIAYLN